MNLSRQFPWIVVALAGVYLLMRSLPPHESADGFQLHEFGKIPAVDRGRIKPLDSVARTSLIRVSNKQTYKDANKQSQPAIKWLLDVMTARISDNTAAERDPVIRIEHDQVLNLFQLPDRPLKWRYSLDELRPRAEAFDAQVKRVEAIPANERDEFDAKIWELHERLQVVLSLHGWFVPHILPPTAGEEDWKTLRSALVDVHSSGQESQAFRSIRTMLMAYAKGDVKEFNREVETYRRHLDETMPDQAGVAEFEVFFSHFEPFYHCSILYTLVVLLAVIGWVGWNEPLQRAAFWLALLTLVLHTWALCARMYIQGRPPVTNLYSSAVFIGWGCVIMGLVLERIYKNGMGNATAGLLGSLTTVVAHNLVAGDTLEMMQAVLDTNFWLATHVTVITTGYAATFVAGFIGVALIVGGLVTPWITRERFKTLGQMIYGITCFAMFCSFTGTVLGGIWADQSWGRFWGWDPKENGALLIVLVNALLLHARWGGLVQQRGMAVIAVLGNIITAWSWFGVNMLPFGLHSYGRMEGAVLWMTIFMTSQIAVMGLAAIPLEKWRSFEAFNPRPGAPARKQREERGELTGTTAS